MKSLDKKNLLFEDNHLLVVNKPANYLTQPTHIESRSLQTDMKQMIKKRDKKQGNVFLECIHRIDKPVSGIVVFAKTSKALRRLQKQMREKKIDRRYFALVEGCISEKRKILRHYLVHGKYKALIVEKNVSDAMLAELIYDVKDYRKNATLIDVELITGRYHQIRAQLANIGHAIVGDKKYGSKIEAKEGIKLHHRQMSFIHPVSQKRLSFSCSALL